MNKISSTLFKIAFACLVALGSGFATLTPHFLNYEKSAYESLYKVEEKIGKINDYETYDCNALKKHKADCNIATFQVNTSRSMIYLVEELTKLLLVISLFSVLIGIGIFFYQDKSTREKFFSNGEAN